jgi:anti-anti-sigma factor
VTKDPQPEYSDFQHLGKSLLRFRSAPRVVVNLCELELGDSAFLAGLIALNKAMLAAGGRVALCELSPVMREIFAHTRLDTFFDTFQREVDALEAVNSETGNRE